VSSQGRSARPLGKASGEPRVPMRLHQCGLVAGNGGRSCCESGKRNDPATAFVVIADRYRLSGYVMEEYRLTPVRQHPLSKMETGQAAGIDFVGVYRVQV
jgi:hypothetical protein